MPTFAAIDIGSNSVRLKISRLHAGRLKEIHEDREVTRLGEGVFSGGLLSPESMSQTVQVLRRFNRAIQECGTDSVKVVATAALRDARNSRAFLEWVRSTTGWTIEIISGLEEARLIHLGIVSAGRLGAHSVLLVDLGRRQLRAHAFARRTSSGYGELAARGRAPDRRIPQARSAAQERTEAAPGICGARDYAHSRSDQGRAGGRSDRHLRHRRRTGGRRQPPARSPGRRRPATYATAR